MNTPYHGIAMWDSEVAAKVPPPTLRRDKIVETAVRLADDGGLESVSIRKTATQLGVGPMRLYTHVPTKQDLLDLMVERVYAEIADGLGPHTPRGVDWRERLHVVARSFRQAALRHKWFIDLLSGRPHLGPNALTVLEATASAVQAGAKLPTPAATRYALGTINAYLIGAVRADVLERRLGEADGVEQATWENQAREYLHRTLDDGHFPTLKHLAFSESRVDPDTEYAWGLDVVLDGIVAGRTI